MKPLLCAIVLSWLPLLGISQDLSLPERLMTRRLPSCQDIQYNCAVLVPQLHAAGRKDTLAQLLRFWKGQCGNSPFHFAYTSLTAIRERRFAAGAYNPSTISGMLQAYLPDDELSYRRWYGLENSTGVLPTPANDSFRTFISALAKQVLDIDSLSIMEKQIAAFYAAPGTAVLNDFNTSLFGNGKGRYNRIYGAPNVSGSTTDYSLISGIWVPNGKMAVLGNHAYLGMLIGAVGKRWEHAANINIRFLRSAAPIRVEDEDSVFLSDYYLGIYFGYDAHYALLAKDRHRLELLGGIGFDMQQLLDEERFGYRDGYSKTVGSLNLNGGLGYRFRFSGSGWLGVQAKYHVVNFSNRRGTDISGNAVTIGIIASVFDR